MKMNILRGSAVVASIAALVGLSTPSQAAVQTFPVSGSLQGSPVDVSASFTPSTDLVTVTLTNLQANPTSIIQAISDIFFVATQGDTALTSGTGIYEPTGTYINISAAGVPSAGTNPAGGWGLTNTGGTYHLNVLCGSGCSGPAGLIIGPGPYTNANGSIAGNDPHNPFADQTATFSLALAGATTDTIISSVVFSFGTEGAIIPIPAAVWLFISGLLGLIGIARRKQAVPQPALAAA